MSSWAARQTSATAETSDGDRQARNRLYGDGALQRQDNNYSAFRSMSADLNAAHTSGALPVVQRMVFPAMINNVGDQAKLRYAEFFTARIRNPNTRAAYLTAVNRFLAWCHIHALALDQLQPVIVATYVESLLQTHSIPTVKQHMAAVKMFFDDLVLGQVCPRNPCHGVRAPRYVIKQGKTPVLTAQQARELLASIDVTTLIGLRDRALIATMVYSFARVGAVVAMNVEDYWQNGKRCWLRLHEKGGKHHEVPAHHNAEAYLDAYLEAAGIAIRPKSPLFRSIPARTQTLTDRRIHRRDVLAMVKRRCLAVGLPSRICCHTFRATGITAYLSNGGILEKAQVIAAHESPRTTRLYDRRADEISLDEIERILI